MKCWEERGRWRRHVRDFAIGHSKFCFLENSSGAPLQIAFRCILKLKSNIRQWNRKMNVTLPTLSWEEFWYEIHVFWTITFYRKNSSSVEVWTFKLALCIHHWSKQEGEWIHQWCEVAVLFVLLLYCVLISSWTDIILTENRDDIRACIRPLQFWMVHVYTREMGKNPHCRCSVQFEFCAVTKIRVQFWCAQPSVLLALVLCSF